MKYRIILSPDAKAGISSAVDWYQRTNPGLGFRLLSKAEAAINRIRQYTYSFPRVSGVTRRAILHRFPYSVFYAVGKALVIVMAVRHQRQSGILRSELRGQLRED